MLTVEQETDAWRPAKPTDAPHGNCPYCGRTAPPPGGITPIFGLMTALDANGGDLTERELAVELDGYGFTPEQLRAAATALEAARLITTSRAFSAEECACSFDECVGCQHFHLVFAAAPREAA